MGDDYFDSILEYSEKKNLSRRYAVGMERLKAGYMGFSDRHFAALHLTTRQGDDNSVKRFRKDLNKMLFWMKKEFGVEAYAGCLALTPDNHLLHWHGVLRFGPGIVWETYHQPDNTWDLIQPVNRRQVGDKWNEIHNAFAVEITPARGESFIKQYIATHITHDIGGMGVDGRVVSSGNWIRRDYKLVEAGVIRYLCDGESSKMLMCSWKWNMKRSVLNAWCQGEPYLFKHGNYEVFVKESRYIFSADGQLYP